MENSIHSKYCLQEDEVEQLQAQRDELKRENFKLKQSVMRTEEKLRLLEIRKGTPLFCKERRCGSL